MIGTVVGNHRILSRISEGGMGVVYRAEHVMLGRPAAVKVLLPQYSHARDVVARFFNEARATSSVRHPNIVEVYDFGHLADGQAYIVMEFCDGQTLSRRLHARPIGEAELIALGRQIASALSAAHERGVVHRDLKPDNIILVPDPEQPSGRPKLVDFGIAKLADPGAGASNTRTGALLGTPTYMSPEQCRGAGQVDHRSDLYSLGCILYEALAGRPPFTADGPGEIIAAHLWATPTPLGATVAVSPDLEHLINSLLAKRADDRPASANAVVALFDQLGAWVPLTHAVPMNAETMIGRAMTTTGGGRAVTSAPTTLGGASGESTGISSGRRAPIGRAWIAASAGIFAAGVIAAIIIATTGSPEPIAPSPATRPSPAAPSVAAPPSVAPVPTPKPAPATAPETATKTATETPTKTATATATETPTATATETATETPTETATETATETVPVPVPETAPSPSDHPERAAPPRVEGQRPIPTPKRPRPPSTTTKRPRPPTTGPLETDL